MNDQEESPFPNFIKLIEKQKEQTLNQMSELAGDDPLTSQIGGDHYKTLKIQPAEFITANGLGFLEGCVIKRVCRHGLKNKSEDIRKAIHELQLILKLTYKEEF